MVHDGLLVRRCPRVKITRRSYRTNYPGHARAVDSVTTMLNPEASRQTAHIFLDAVAVHNRNDATDDDARDEMTGLVLDRLREVGSIQILQDDETGNLTLDFRAAGSGIIAVMVALLDGWVGSSGVDRDVLVSEVRDIIDEHLVE
ncbi:MAG: hypothetical protein JWL79_2945 [Frankiales bacterium]|nr:hypothetical protein [Frankiales bacterium]